MSEQDSSINKTTDTDTATPGNKKAASKKSAGKKTAGKKTAGKATRKKTVAKPESPATPEPTVAAKGSSAKADNTRREQTPSGPTQSAAPATSNKTRADGSGRLALILIIIVIAVLAWLSWQNDWWSGNDSQVGVQQTEQIDQLQQQFAQLQRAIDSQDVRGEVEPMINAAQDQTAENLRSSIESQLQPIAGRADDLQLALNDQRSRLSALENRLADVSSEQQQTQTVQNREQSLLEIKLLLRYARQQLLLNNNVNAAIAAYQDAESVLSAAELADSSALQAALISERQSIQATSTSDISALVNELRGLQQAVSLWPLRGQLAASQANRAANRAADQERRWQDKLRDSFSGLVTVRKAETDIISIEQASLIRQQMALHFQTASLLALQGRQAEFQSVISDAQQLLEQSFTADNRGVQAASETLDSMSEIQLTPEWPTLNESSEQLNLLDRGAIG